MSDNHGNYSQPDSKVTHPLTAKEVVVTEPIKEVYRQIKFMLVCGGDSRCFGAPSQDGKSQALKMIARWLDIDFPNILFIKLSLTNTAGPHSNENLIHLANEVRSRATGTSYVLRDAITKALKKKVIEEGLIKIVLLIDEGQCMKMHDLQFFKDLYNSLAEIDIPLCTIVFGQGIELASTLKDLISGERKDLVRRILGRPRPFRKLRIPGEVESIFKSIDTTPMPDSSGVSWSQFFVRRAWTRLNWRLANETCNFVAAAESMGVLDVEKAGHEERKAASKVISAGMVFCAVRRYLVLRASDDCSDKPWPETRWKEAIADVLEERGELAMDDGKRFKVLT
jgi:hypothetical protein